MDQPRLLFLCHTLPYPPNGGVWIRTYHILRLLSQHFRVTALCFERARGAQMGHDVKTGLEALRGLCEVDAVPLPQEHSRLRFVSDHLRSVITNRAFTLYRYDSHDFRGRLQRLLATRTFDLVHVDSLDLSGYLPMVDHLPVVCVHHNVESELLVRRAGAEKSWWRKGYVRHQASLVRREEQRWCPKVALNVAVSDVDRSRLQEIVPDARVEVVPNGVDTEVLRPSGDDGTPDGGLVFVGTTKWFPNGDALEYFSRDILPVLRARRPGLRVRWVGYSTPEEQRVYGRRYGVELTGYVEDMASLVHDAQCYIVPLRVGGGTRLKILDAWAMGKAVVSTSVGCEGLAAEDGENILIRDDPNLFAEAVEQVLTDEELRRRLAANGRATAERLYSWRSIGEHMNALYASLL